MKRKQKKSITNLPTIREVRVQNTQDQTTDIYPMVVKEVSKVSGKAVGSAEYQDLIAEALLAVVQSHARFKASSGVKFSTYVFPRIRGAAQDRIRKELTYTRFFEPTDVHALAESHGADGIESDISDRMTFLRVVELLEKRLHPTLSLVLVRSFLEEHKDREIAEELGVSRQRVEELRLEALKEMRRYLGLPEQDAPGIDHKREAKQ